MAKRHTRLAVVMLWAALVGMACSQWRKGAPEANCCEGAEACLDAIQEVHGPDPGVEEAAYSERKDCAIFKLSRLGARVIPRILPLLEHPDSRVRRAGMITLSHMEAEAASAVPALIQAFERGPRLTAAYALLSIDDPAALAFLRQHLLELPASLLAVARTNATLMMVDALEDPTTSLQVMKHLHTAQMSGDAEVRLWKLDKAVLYPRLRAALRRELAEPVLRRAADAVCPAPPAWSCQPLLDGCTPRAAFLAWWLSRLVDIHQEEAPEELLQAFQRGDPRLTSAALEALIHFKSPEAVKPLVQELSLRDCRLHALEGLERLGPLARSEAMVPLTALLESREEGWVRAMAARLLASLGQGEAIGPLRRALEADHSEVQAAAAASLRQDSFREHASEVLPVLARLEVESRSPLVRQQARWSRRWFQAPKPGTEEARAFESATFEAWEERRRSAEHCPTVTRREGGSEVKTAHEVLLLHHFRWREPPPETKGACLGQPELEWATFLEPLGGMCLIGQSEGFGGGLSLSGQGARTVLRWGVSADVALRLHGHFVVLTSTPHLHLPEGELLRIDRTVSGTWVAVPWVTLPGSWEGYAYDTQGNLVVATESPPEPIYDGVAAEPECTYDMVRITRDGQLEDFTPRESSLPGAQPL